MPTDATALEIRKFDPALHDRRGFDCGHVRLNNFLKLNAKKLQKNDLSRIYVAIAQGQSQILGYSAINVGRINADALQKRPRGLPTHGEIPVLFLGQIAVDNAQAGAGIGGILMHHVFEKATGIADLAGCYAIVLDIVSDDGKAAFERRRQWYGGFGFTGFPSGPARMFMPMAGVRKIASV